MFEKQRHHGNPFGKSLQNLFKYHLFSVTQIATLSIQVVLVSIYIGVSVY